MVATSRSSQARDNRRVTEGPLASCSVTCCPNLPSDLFDSIAVVLDDDEMTIGFQLQRVGRRLPRREVRTEASAPRAVDREAAGPVWRDVVNLVFTPGTGHRSNRATSFGRSGPGASRPGCG